MIHLLLAVIYLAFIGLGLPDSILGSAWPTMYSEFSVPLSYAGIIYMVIAFGTVVSSLMSDRITLRLGAGKVTAISTALTAISLIGFSISSSYYMLILWAIPYGLGAGAVDAALNNYVALHYESKHMSWLHCMWGVGATVGPYVMGYVLTHGCVWNDGYRIIGTIQIILAAVVFLSLPLWKLKSKQSAVLDADSNTSRKALSLREILSIPGAKQIMICFFCYSLVEQTTGLWASSYLVLSKGVSARTAAELASMFYLGITIGRAVSGFIAIKLSDNSMIRLGMSIIAVAVIIMLLPLGSVMSIVGFIMIGLGCAPIYPCIIHSTPANFGAENSQAVIGVQMASAYIGTTFMPPLFGLIANNISTGLLPLYLLVGLITMFAMHSSLLSKVKK